MATITANTGSNNYNTNGAWVGGVQPTAADDVVIPASAVVTIPTATTVLGRSMTVQASGTLAFASTTAVLTLGDATAGAGNVALSVSATATITLTGIGTINFISTSATTQTIASGGKTLPNLTFDGVGSSYQFTSAITIGSSTTLTLTRGTLDTNGQTCSWGLFSSSGSSTRTLTLGASAITISGSTWNTSTTTGLTFNANTSSITHVSGNATFQTGGLTFNNVTLGGNAGTNACSGASTFANLTISGFASGRASIANNITVTGTFTMNSSATSMSQLQSSQRGVQRTITAAVTALSNHNIQDILGAGAATWDATNNVGDNGGNSNITFASPVTRYWVATSGGNFSATSSWSASSGGASGASIPLPHDTAVFDANSITSAARTITINVQCVPSLDYSNLLNTPIISSVITNGNIYVKGSVKYTSAVTASGTTTLVFTGRTPATVQSGGMTLANFITNEMVGSTLTCSGDLAISNTLILSYGTFDANGFNVTTPALSSGTTFTRTIAMGSGTWTLNGTSGNVWNTGTDTNLTVTAGTSTIAITDTGASSKTFNGSGNLQTFNNVTVTSGGAGAVIFSGILSFNDFTCTGGPKTITFSTASKTIRGNFNVRGTAGNLISITSLTNGSAVNLNKSSGTVSSDYLSIKDSAAQGGARWFAGANSTNVSGNSGWVFTVANFLPTHTTDANKRKAATATHTTDALKQMKRSHTTDALKTTAGGAREMRREHYTDVAIIKARGTKTHTADANTRIPQLRTHNTSANKRKATAKTHTTASYLRKTTRAKLVQKIETLAVPYTGQGTAGSYEQIPHALIQLDTSAYDGEVTFYFEAVITNLTGTGTTAYADLFNVTDNVGVSGSELTEVDLTVGASPNRHRAQVTLSGNKLYIVRAKHSFQGTKVIVSSARIVVAQQGNITKTQIFQSLGGTVISTSVTSSSNLSAFDAKFLYEAAKYDGTISVTHEGVLNGASGFGGIYDLTSSSIVSGSTLTSSGSSYNYQKSSAITLTDGHVYQPTLYASSGSAGQATRHLVFTITGGFTKYLAYIPVDKSTAHSNASLIYPSFNLHLDYVQNYDPTEFGSANLLTSYEADISTNNAANIAYGEFLTYNNSGNSVSSQAASEVSYTGTTAIQRVRSGKFDFTSGATDTANGTSYSASGNNANTWAAFIVLELNQFKNITHEPNHTTSSVLKKQPTKTHTTDTASHRSFSPNHTTDTLKRSIGQTKAHTTDTFKKVSGILKTHTTNSLKRKQSTVVNNTDSLKRKSPLVTHTTSSFVRKGNVKTHTADSLKRKSVTIAHTADALRLSRSTKSHTTSTNRRLGFSKVHTTDSSKRTGITRSHSTDTSRYVVGPCVWVSPANFATGVLGTTPLVFIIPVAAAAMHFQLQIDTVSTFDNILQEFDSWVDQTNWQYWNGSAWVAITSGGVSPSFAGNQARFIPSLTSGTYYRRVRGRVLL